MVGANSQIIINNMRNDPSGLTAVAVGVALALVVIVFIALACWSWWKNRDARRWVKNRNRAEKGDRT